MKKFTIPTAQFSALSIRQTDGLIKLVFLVPTREWEAVAPLGRYARYLCRMEVDVDIDNPPGDVGSPGGDL